MGLTNLATIFAAVLVSSDAVSHLFTYLFIYVSVSYVFYYVQFYCLLSLLHLWWLGLALGLGLRLLCGFVYTLAVDSIAVVISFAFL